MVVSVKFSSAGLGELEKNLASLFCALLGPSDSDGVLGANKQVSFPKKIHPICVEK